MSDSVFSVPSVINWQAAPLYLRLRVSPDRLVTLASVSTDAEAPSGTTGRPLVEVVTTSSGKRTGGRLIDTVQGASLRYTGHLIREDDAASELIVDLSDPVAGLEISVVLRSYHGIAALTSHVRVSKTGSNPIGLLAVSSFAYELPNVFPDFLDLHLAQNEWLAENRWTRTDLRSLLPTVSRNPDMEPRGKVGVSSSGTWSTGDYLPMGALEPETGTTFVWQIEHNGAWHWQVGETQRGTYVALFGPTDADHQWSLTLQQGDKFSSVPVTIAISKRGFEGAVQELTRHRRKDRRGSPVDAALPVIFNDYMNTLEADPSTEKLLPLIRAAAECGAEYFCIDAGWYSDAPGWWDSVGAWEPSKVRFPGGLIEVIDAIRGQGMVPGLWLEPEVVGINSPVVDQLPLEAFFHRHGERVGEDGRFHLDFSHPAIVDRMNRIVDGLIHEYGLGYFKFDYNTNPGPGTDSPDGSVGSGLLRANRGWLTWLDDLLLRHPDLIIENCASGGMRSDWALMSRLAIQSTSDQQLAERYVPIAASAPTAVLPEQAGIWSYPQPKMSAGETVTTLANSLLGRPILAGRVDLMTPAELSTVRSATTAYKQIRALIPQSVPAWPIGLPSWEDPWVATALQSERAYLVTVWRRHGDVEQISIPVPHEFHQAQVSQVFPIPSSAYPTATWREDESGDLTIRMQATFAVTIAITLPE